MSAAAMGVFSPGAPLLVELFVEELPPKALKALGEAFAKGITSGLVQRGLVAADAAVTSYATPRRLAVAIADVRAAGPDAEVVTKLMPVTIALDAAGQPTEALRKRLRKEGLEALADRWPNDVSATEHAYVASDGKVDAVHLKRLVQGQPLAVALQAALGEALARLPIPKVMQYQLADGWQSVSFVRPAHGLVALHGESVVPLKVLGLEAGRTTHGHRFEAKQAAITLRDATSYAAQLRDEGRVIAGYAERRAEIERQLAAAAAKEAGLHPVDDPALLDEVTSLVEWPNVVTCRFEEDFLAVPAECLVLTMKANQKYFPLLDAAGRLSSRFLVVANVQPADASRIVEGNERVVRPRLADARFFFDQDRKRSLGSRVPELDRVVYHAKLGSQGDRVRRLRAVGTWLAPHLGADAAEVDRACELAKADLLTDMVGEFPELQGIMGGYYAAHDGEAPAVATALREQYVHARGDDAAPLQPVAEALRIADRAEALVGLWGVGAKPTGERDPFALRRSALVLIRAFEKIAAGPEGRHLDLHALLAATADAFAPGALAAGTVDEVEAFVYDRLANPLVAAGADARAVDAVVSLRPPLGDVARRLDAVRAFQALPEAAALAAANKRVGNILKKAEGFDAVSASIDPARFTEPAERELHEALMTVAAAANGRLAAGDDTGSLRALAALRAPVDAFFDDVMVNADDPAVRANRLALLARLHAAMNRVADLSRLAT